MSAYRSPPDPLAPVPDPPLPPVAEVARASARTLEGRAAALRVLFEQLEVVANADRRHAVSWIPHILRVAAVLAGVTAATAATRIWSIDGSYRVLLALVLCCIHAAIAVLPKPGIGVRGIMPFGLLSTVPVCIAEWESAKRFSPPGAVTLFVVLTIALGVTAWLRRVPPERVHTRIPNIAITRRFVDGLAPDVPITLSWDAAHEYELVAELPNGVRLHAWARHGDYVIDADIPAAVPCLYVDHTEIEGATFDCTIAAHGGKSLCVRKVDSMSPIGLERALALTLAAVRG